MKKIIFVCTGNTCRSPMAMAVFNNAAKEKGLNWVADSAGLAAAYDPINPKSVEVLAKIGISFNNYTSKRLNYQMADEANIIAVMTNEHLAALVSAGIPQEKIIVLGGGIADPYGRDLDTYYNCLLNIKSAIDALIEGDVLNG